ncbi:MAG: hypothetical protein IPO92_20545 [Saprospiraceae bacterium]|nr:hypothetical protein [Saprospiraceae bacterium]
MKGGVRKELIANQFRTKPQNAFAATSLYSFRENVGVQFPCVTRLLTMKMKNTHKYCSKYRNIGLSLHNEALKKKIEVELLKEA